MKKIIFLLFFITSASYAQPSISQPNNLSLCDVDNDSIEPFDLTFTIVEILNGLDSALHTVAYYETLSDAQNDINSISGSTNYVNSANPQTIYVRVWENSDVDSFSLTDFEILATPTPDIIDPPSYDICGGLGSVPFDLTSQDELITQNNPDYVVSYYLNEADANSNSNPIISPFTPFVNFQDVFVRVEDLTTGCTSFTTLELRVFGNPNIDDLPNLYLDDMPFDGFTIFDLTLNESLITGGTSISYFESSMDANNNINPIVNPTAYNNISNPQTIHVRVEISSTGCFSTSVFDVLAIDPTQTINIPDANFKAQLIAASPDNFIARDINNDPFKIDFNDDGEIQVIEAFSVYELSVQNSNISDLTGIEEFVTLKYLRCTGNQLTNIDVSQNINLIQLWCSDNLLTSLDVTQNTSLVLLLFWDNQIANIDLSQNSGLAELQCYNNQLTSLDVSQNPNLVLLNCHANLLTSFDGSQNLNLFRIGIWDNQLTTLNIKNGVVETELIFSNNPNLAFICADEAQVASVQAQAEPMTVVSSYCTFEPGGDFNTISGSIIFDDNEDGCDPTDLPQPHIKIDINDGTDQGSTFTDTNGNYAFYTLDGSFDITPNLEQPSWFTVSPIATTIPFIDTNNNVATQDFCMSANGVHNDVEIAIAPITPARPGFDAVYQIVYNNKGNQTLSGTFDLTYDETVLDFISATEIPDVQNPGNLVWNYTDLLPFENRTVYLTLNVNSPTETPAVNIGDELGFVVTINPITGDEFTGDNMFEYKQIVVGSFDPNDITCLQGNILPTTEIGNFLHYIINFENEGTAPAENVVVEVEVDEAKFDINTLRILNASHDVQTQVANNKVKFIFIDVNLEASGGHGNILIRIKSDEALLSGDTVMKSADIHFDYNFPIETNIANTTYQNLSVDEFQIDNTIQLYPNPTRNTINVKASSQIESIQIYDIHGRLILTKLIDENEALLDISEYSSGVYMFKVNSTKGSIVEKIIKN